MPGTLTGPFHLGLLSFNGSQQFVDLTTATGPSSVGAVLPQLPAPSPAGLSASLTGFSVEVVVQWTALLPGASVFDFSNGPGSNDIALGEPVSAAQVAFTTTSSSTPGQQSGVTVLSAAASGTWYHIVVTVQPSSGGASSSITAFVNGVAVSSAVEAETFGASYPLSVPRAMAYLGRSAGGSFFDGLLDTLRVYSYALTPSMVQALYSFYVNPLQAYTPPPISAVFVDYNSTFSVTETVAQLGLLSPPSNTPLTYVDNTAYSSALPSVFLFSIRALDLSAITNGLEGFDNVTITLPIGPALTPLSSAAACQPRAGPSSSSLSLFTSAGNAPPVCDFALSWTAPFSGLLQVAYAVAVSQPVALGTGVQSHYDDLLVSVAFTYQLVVYPTPAVGVVFVDYNSSFTVNASVAQLGIGGSDPSYAYTDSATYSTNRPGSIAIAVIQLSPLPVLAEGSFPSTSITVPPGAALTPTNISGGTSGCSVAGRAASGGVAYAVSFTQPVCCFVVSWSAPFAGQLVASQDEQFFLPRGALGDTYEGSFTAYVNFTSGPSTTSSSSSSSTGVASAFSDPRFSGFWSQSFYVSGLAGRVYSLISDAELTLNAHFVQLERIRCPLIGRHKERCFDHAGTYFGVLAIVTREGDRLRVTAGGVDEGFHDITLNDRSVLLTPAADEAAIAPSSTSSGSIVVRPLSSHSVVVTAGLYELRIDSVDLYVDVAEVVVSDWARLVEEVQPEGLLGRTWNADVGAPENEAEVELYREQDDNILGCRTARDRFCAQRTPVVQAE